MCEVVFLFVICCHLAEKKMLCTRVVFVLSVLLFPFLLVGFVGEITFPLKPLIMLCSQDIHKFLQLLLLLLHFYMRKETLLENENMDTNFISSNLHPGPRTARACAQSPPDASPSSRGTAPSTL